MYGNPLIKMIAGLMSVAVIVCVAMLVLPVVGAVIVGVIALMALMAFSGWVARIFGGNSAQSSEDPVREATDVYSRNSNTNTAAGGKLLKKWSKDQAEDAEIVVEERRDR